MPTLVLVDEFSAIAPHGVVRLFGRGRSAGLSLLLGTQELADLRPSDNPSLADQVLGNVTTLIAHRQVVAQSAETLAGVMGTAGRGRTPNAPLAGLAVPVALGDDLDAPDLDRADAVGVGFARRARRRGQSCVSFPWFPATAAPAPA